MSIGWTWSASPPTAPPNAPAAPRVSDLGWCDGCGTPRDRLRESREPDVARVDLAGAALDLLAWGADLPTFEWFEAPPSHALDAAVALLTRLGAVATRGDRVAVTPLGRQLQRWPVHVRLARILVEARGAANVAAACALLGEGAARGPGGATTSCDLLADLDRFAAQPAHVRQVARELERLARAVLDDPATASASEDGLRRALFAGYADRLARRRPGAADRVTLASGHGATLARESGVRDGEFLVALDVRGADRHGVAEARIHLASQVEPEWIAPTAIAVEHTLDQVTGQVRARRVARVDALLLSETPVPVVPEAAAAVLAEAWLVRGPGEGDAELLRRLRFAGLDVDLPALVRRAAGSARRLDDVRIVQALPPDIARAPPASGPAGAAGTERTAGPAHLRRRWIGDRVGEAAGALRSGRHAGPRRGAGAGDLQPAGPQRSAGADHPRPAELLAAHLPGSAPGAARPLSQASLARRPVDRGADAPDDTILEAVGSVLRARYLPGHRRQGSPSAGRRFVANRRVSAHRTRRRFPGT